MENSEIALIFKRIADILEFQDGDRFRISAYRNGALNIEEMTERLQDLYHEDPKKLNNLPAIGERLKEKIIEILKTGKLRQYEELKGKVPLHLLDLLDLDGLGPKKLTKL